MKKLFFAILCLAGCEATPPAVHYPYDSTPKSVASSEAPHESSTPRKHKVAIRRPVTVGPFVVDIGYAWANEYICPRALFLSFPAGGLAFSDESTGRNVGHQVLFIPMQILNNGLNPATIPAMTVVDERGATYEPEYFPGALDNLLAVRLNPSEAKFGVVAFSIPTNRPLMLIMRGDLGEKAELPIEEYAHGAITRDPRAVYAARSDMSGIEQAAEERFEEALGAAANGLLKSARMDGASLSEVMDRGRLFMDAVEETKKYLIAADSE